METALFVEMAYPQLFAGRLPPNLLAQSSGRTITEIGCATRKANPLNHHCRGGWMDKCAHFNFHADVTVNRLVYEAKQNQVNAFVAEIKVHCMDCGLPFEWIGFETGFRGDVARVDVSAQQLRAPLKPKGCRLMPGIPGYDIRAN
jgi:hypothetical protein